METAVVIPIKSFRAAKGRLAGRFDPRTRAELARTMAARVVAAGRPFPVFVACDHDEVATWATERGAEVLWTPGLGLNGAIDHATDVVRGKGADHVVIAHSDLPLAASFAHLCRPDVVTLVPDHRFDGTNVQAKPTSVSTPASYGAASFRRHLADALAHGCRVQVVVDVDLSLDVDTVDDCRHPKIAAALGDVPGLIEDADRAS